MDSEEGKIVKREGRKEKLEEVGELEELRKQLGGRRKCGRKGKLLQKNLESVAEVFRVAVRNTPFKSKKRLPQPQVSAETGKITRSMSFKHKL